MTASSLRPGRRPAYGRAVVLVCMLAIIAAWAAWVWGARATEQKLRERTAHWAQIVDRRVAIGEPRADAERWAHATFPVVESSLPGGPLDAEAERVDVLGLPFPCRAWIVLVEIRFGADGKVISRDATRGGDGCL